MLIEKINKYIELEERINELVDNIDYIKNKRKQNKALKEISTLEDKCDLLFNIIREEIDSLSNDEVLELQICLNDKIGKLIKENDKLSMSLDNSDIDINIILDRIDKYENKIYLYNQVISYVNNRSNVNKVNILRQL